MGIKKDWPWYKVKAELEAKGKTLASLARENGFTPSAAQKVKRIPIPQIQSLIADTVGAKPQTIWPTRYDRWGKPTRTYAWVKKYSKSIPRRNGQSQAAA